MRLDHTDVIRILTYLMKSRQIEPSDNSKLVIHSDRGIQFSSKKYFVVQYQKYFSPSMSTCCNPKGTSSLKQTSKTYL